MAKRTRDVPVLFWVSPHEMEMIREKMAQMDTGNLSAYLRKMAIAIDNKSNQNNCQNYSDSIS